MFPVLYQSEYFTLTSLGVLGALGFFVSIFLLTRFVERRQLDLQFVVDHFWSFFLVTFLFARAEVIFMDIPLFTYGIKQGWMEIVQFSNFLQGIWDIIGSILFRGGIGFFGGVIGFLLVLFIQSIRLREDFGKWLDVIVLSALPGVSIGYLGQFLDGAGYGTPTNLPWGFTFENIAVPFTIPIHPVQIYTALISVIIFVVILQIFKSKKMPGLAGMIGIIGFAVARIFFDFLRGDVALMINGLRLQQWTSIAASIILVIMFFVSRNLKFKKSA